MGVQPKKILEPACGTGNFFGLLPERMAAANLYGVELDSITGRIAKQLYPDANISVTGFEKASFRDGSFDLAVGNVPFGSYSVSDPNYDKHSFYIHDYFFAKALDKVRPGGIVAFVTSHGTLDKQNPDVRQYIARRAELLGAVRLPNNAFKRNAGTDVTTDILFLQKREQERDIEPDWVRLGQTPDGVPVNSYFAAHPEMVLGTMRYSQNMYGNKNDTACIPPEGAVLSEQLAAAMGRILQPQPPSLDELDVTEDEIVIPAADPETRNYSYVLQDGKLYYCIDSELTPVNPGKAQEERIRGMMELRDITRALIDAQLHDGSDAAIKGLQTKLNRAYDSFTARHGLINDAANRRAFGEDSSCPLLCSLEELREDGTLDRKADMFSKRTIQRHQAATSVDTPSEALTVSIQEKGCVDLGYMAQLLGGSGQIERIVHDLRGVIFKDPQTGPFTFDGAWDSGWQTADEYLSGNVREKLQAARAAAGQYPEFAVNAAALEQVQPRDLDGSEIDVRMGATWIDPKYYRQFMFELLKTPKSEQGKIFDVSYSPLTGQWSVKGKSINQKGNLIASSTYGTDRASAYRIIDDILNLRDTRIFDLRQTHDGEKRVLNAEATQIAQDKQKQIKDAFREWLWRDPERRRTLVAQYNTIFNSTRPREYTGGHLVFPGMNPEIELLPHQKNAVARTLYGGNTLLAHVVGAGKTYEMIAAAMESKRLGLCHKSMFAVPNHMIDQFSRDIYKLYPGAKVLTVTKKDFEKQNRKKFCSRIATGDYDAVVIGHSQFEKIPVSRERQEKTFRSQIDDITHEIMLAKQQNQEPFTVKQLERTKKSLQVKLERLYKESRKDDTLNFEELGIDRLFIDEAHLFKNLFTPTKLRNVAGIGTSDAQKATDLFLKCRYLDEATGGRGVTFATGTPISNSMTEMHVMLRYLLHDTLERANLLHFDSWASSFGETKTEMELAPEGKGFRSRTRFARFFNLPELMTMFKDCADIQTADMLKLPVPEAEYTNVETAPSAYQEDMVDQLSMRADEVRNGNVEPNVDNMLCITNDGRKLALDQRIINPLLPDDPDSKINACVKNVLAVWEETKPRRCAQLVFCDLSTPKGDGTFNAYDDMRNKLMAQGVPPEEIAFIHDADTDAKKAALFANVRSGKVRVLLGSTAKMGAGTNIQDNLIALHHLDCPWRPADLEQREGRIVRKGNRNKKVKIYRYVTKGTFDAYSWAVVESKQKFIAQIMTSKSPLRSCEDIDGTALSYAEVKALAAGSPLIKERMELDTEIKKLTVLKSSHQRKIFHLEDYLAKVYPQEIQKARGIVSGCEADMRHLAAHSPKDPDSFKMTVDGVCYTDKKEAGSALLAACKAFDSQNGPREIGEYRGFKMSLWLDSFSSQFRVTLKNTLSHVAEIGSDIFGNIARLNHVLDAIPQRLDDAREKISSLETQRVEAQSEVSKPFPQEARLREMEKRFITVTALLNDEEKARQEARAQGRMDSAPSVMKRLNQLKESAPVAAAPKPERSRDAACL